MRTVRPKADPHSPMKFENVLFNMPSFLISSYDPLTHKTIASLVDLAKTQLEFYREGEPSDIETADHEADTVRFIETFERDHWYVS